MFEQIPPGLILIAGAVLAPLLRNAALRNAYMLALPLLGLWGLFVLEPGVHWQMKVFGYDLAPVRVDALSLVFGYVFHIAAALAVIYAFHIRDLVQQVAALLYAGSTIGATFAGDLITLFVYWEGTAITSVFLIWASRTDATARAGVRYLVIQISSGLLLLGGMILLYSNTGSIQFDRMTLSGTGTWMIFAAIGIKAAFPLLHVWVPDAYPRATITGTVFLSAFTTKLAIYALARAFPGTELLIWIGMTMVVLMVFYALIENDLRRLLAYSLVNQLGFMVAGVGIGTELSINGAAAHAFASVLYQGLLFMCIGAVLFRTGTAKASELGGLFRSMPWTAAFCIVGAASISAVPLFSGFATKSLIIDAAAEGGHAIIWAALLLSSAGVVLHSGIKVVHSAFFGPDSGVRCAEAPPNMLVAMALAAALSIGIGIWYAPLHAILPHAFEYQVFTASHVITHLQIVAFAALAYMILVRTGLFPRDVPAINLDFDWSYRRLGKVLGRQFQETGSRTHFAFMTRLERRTKWFIGLMFRHHGPEGVLARTWPTGSTVLWVAVLLALYMVFYFF